MGERMRHHSLLCSQGASAMRRVRGVLLIVVLVLSALSGMLQAAWASSSEVQSEPIQIGSDQDLEWTAAEKGWPGDGSVDNPFRLEGCHIAVDGADAIQISWTTLHLVIQDCDLSGTGDWTAGIRIDNAQNVSVLGNRISGFTNGIQAKGGGGFGPPLGIVLDSNEISSSANGIMLAGRAEQATIMRNVISDSGIGIRLEAAFGVELLQNRLQANGVGISIERSGGTLLLSNLIQNSSGPGIHTSLSTGTTIEATTAEHNGIGLEISSSERTHVVGGVYSRNLDQGIVEGNSKKTRITGADVSENGRGGDGEAGHGIFLRGSEFTEILNSTFRNQSTAVMAWAIKNASLEGNVLEGNGNGTLVLGDGSLRIVGNSMRDNEQHLFVGVGKDVLIAFNSVSDGCRGIHILGGKDVVIRSNVVARNHRGISIVNSENSLVYDNLLWNTLNAGDSSTSSRWSLPKAPGPNIVGGPYVGGNYWADYTGVDVDGDGLGETPHHLHGLEIHDAAPLVKPTGLPLALPEMPGAPTIDCVTAELAPPQA